MKHPQAARTSCRDATSLKGATPVARQSRFQGVSPLNRFMSGGAQPGN
jgi:hypothetical protein